MKVYTCNELLDKSHPIKTYFLKPLFFPGSLAMLYAAPGIGKTFTALWMAAAMAGGGSFLKWASEKAARVLYVDGEMGSEALQERLQKLAVAIDFNIEPQNLNFLCPDESNEGEIPLISDLTSHAKYADLMRDKDVLILDNYDCLTARAGKEGDEEVWARVWKLLKQLRAQGKSILIVHHAGKGGAQLGTSKKEQPLNWIIELSRPVFYKASEGTRFDLKFTKSRAIRGPDLETLTVELGELEERFIWSWANRDSELNSMIEKMANVGMTAHQISESLGLSLYAVKSALKKDEEPVKGGDSPYFYDEDSF